MRTLLNILGQIWPAFVIVAVILVMLLALYVHDTRGL